MFRALVVGMGRLLSTFYDFIPSYGVGIILLTVTVRLAMLPLSVKSAKMMQANRPKQERLRKLQPEIKKLKEKYGNDRAKLYEEQQKLMKEADVNVLSSFSGCLPQLVQAPVLYAMYQVLSGCNKLFGTRRVCKPEFFIPKSSDLYGAIVRAKANFLSMDLSLLPSKVFKTGGLGQAWPYYVLVALMGITMWYQFKQNAKMTPSDPQAIQMQKMMRFMPIMFTFFALNFPIGLCLYWTATNVWTIGQQHVLIGMYGPSAPIRTKAAPAPASGLVAPSEPSANGDAQLAKTVSPNNQNGAQPKSNKPKGSGARKRRKRKKR